MRPEPGQVCVAVRLPRRRLARHVVEKGSIAVDGVGLAAAAAKGATAGACLVPHTVRTTNFASRRAGDAVNIETDIPAKYALR